LEQAKNGLFLYAAHSPLANKREKGEKALPQNCPQRVGSREGREKKKKRVIHIPDQINPYTFNSEY